MKKKYGEVYLVRVGMQRVRVPGGWVVTSFESRGEAYGESSVYVPDPGWKWDAQTEGKDGTP